MPSPKCYPSSDPKAQWSYCPSYGAAVLFIVLFSFPTVAHITQAVIYRKPFAIVIIVACVWELAGYIFRSFSVQHQLNETFYTAQQLLILLSPLWINAFVYMVMGRMIHFFLPRGKDRVFGIRARRITLMFVLFDLSAFLVQLMGGSMANSQNSKSTQKQGLHIYMGGVGLQLVYIFIFIVLAVRFQQLVTRQGTSDIEILPLREVPPQYSTHNSSPYHKPSATSTITNQDPHSIEYGTDNIVNLPPTDPTSITTDPNPNRTVAVARKALISIYVALGLIIYRNIYRLAEFSSGYSSITRHEWYTYFFDAVPMLAAILIFNFAHPGRFLKGTRCDFSEETKKIKEEKKEKKRQKKSEKEEKKRQKSGEKIQRKQEKEEVKRMKKEGKSLR